MDVQVQVAGQITSSPTRNGGTKFDIPLSNGMKVTTFDVALATKASQSGGQLVTARIDQKPNPRGGVYNNLVELSLPGETLAPELPAAGTPLGGSVSPSQPFNPSGAIPITPAAPRDRSGGYSGGMSAEDKVRVTKLSCISSAATIFSGSGDVEATLEAAVRIFNSLATPPATQEPEKPAQDAQAVAAFVAAQAGQPVVQVGTEGVVPTAEPAALPWTTA